MTRTAALKRLLTLGLGWLCTACSMQPAAAPASATQSWRKIEFDGENVVVYTDMQGQGALDWARSLAQTRSAMLDLIWGNSKAPPAPTVVLMFRRPTDAGRFLPPGALAMVRRSIPFGDRLVFSPGSKGIEGFISHEMAHHLSHFYMPNQPLWFAEGLATFLETVRYDPQTGQATLGLMPPNVKEARTLATDLSIQGILDQKAYDHSVRGYGFYIGAYGIFTNLVNRHEDDFAQFQRGLSRLQPWRAAWAQHLSDVTPERLGKELATKGVFTLVQREVSRINPDVHITPITSAQAHGLFATAAADSQLALEEARAGLIEDPNEILSLAALFHYGGLPKTERQALVDKALKAHPESSRSWDMACMLSTDDAVRLKMADKAVALDPFNPSARIQRAAARILNGRAESALADADLSIRLSYPSVFSLRVYAASLAANKRCDQALEALANELPGAPAEELKNLRLGDTPAEQECARLAAQGSRAKAN
ncbi:MAG TPA: hypothetical protein VFQ61_19645 [Polyangiaceae bacterium]|nr:hypothetical protein [Polyangiaceae bacterium]